MRGCSSSSGSWKGWDDTYNTNEPARNLLDKSLIEDFDAARRAGADLAEAKYMEREAFMAEMMQAKEGTWCFTVPVPACANSGVAHPLLTATSEEHGEPLEVVETAGRRATSVQLNTFLAIGRDLSLEFIQHVTLPVAIEEAAERLAKDDRVVENLCRQQLNTRRYVVSQATAV